MRDIVIGPAAPPVPTTETELLARLDEVEGAMNSRVLALQEEPHTGARARRNHDRTTAWLRLDEERDWLLAGLGRAGKPRFIPYPPAPRVGLVAEAMRSPGRSYRRTA